MLRIIGTETEGGSAQTISSGAAFAFPFTALDTGPLNALVYRTSTAASGTATSVRVAILSDVAGKPGAVLGSEGTAANGADTTGAKTETLYEATGINANIVAGTKYWLAILPLGGNVRIRTGVEATAYKVGSTATIGAASGWVSISTGGVLYFAGLGTITVGPVSDSVKTNSVMSVGTVRQVLTAVDSVATHSAAVNPAAKAISFTDTVTTHGAASATTKRATGSVVDSVVTASHVTPAIYGDAVVHRYPGGGPYNVIVPLGTATPASPVIIFLHESSADEYSEAQALTSLPKPGESNTGTLAKAMSTYNFAEQSNAAGFVCFVPAYRKINEGAWPTGATEDIIALIAWVKQHCAAWNGDPNKVCILGASYGSVYGYYNALKLNQSKPGYITAVANLSGPVDFPDRIEGRDKEVEEAKPAQEAWEAEHPGFTEAELETWEEEHGPGNTKIVEKLAQYLGVAANKLKETGWLHRGGAEEKATLKKAEELSPTNNLGVGMPFIYYLVTKKDVTPQQQGVAMGEAAASFGQPGRYHFNGTIAEGHGWSGAWGKESAPGSGKTVGEEVRAFFLQAISPAIVPLASDSVTTHSTMSVATRRAAGPVSDSSAPHSTMSMSSTRTTSVADSVVTHSTIIAPGNRLVDSVYATGHASVSTRRTLGGFADSYATNSSANARVQREVALVASSQSTHSTVVVSVTRIVPGVTDSAQATSTVYTGRPVIDSVRTRSTMTGVHGRVTLGRVYATVAEPIRLGATFS